MFLRAFLISFAAAFTQTLAVLIDNMIIAGFYGEAEIAASSLAGPFFWLLEIPAAGIAAGVSVLAAREIGAGRIENVNLLLGRVFFLLALVMIPVSIISHYSSDGMAVLFGASGATAVLKDHAAQYLRGLSYEILPYTLFCVLSPLVTMDNGGKLITIASIAGSVSDIVLDLLSVRYGWGLFGIGAASSVSAWIYFAVTMTHFLRKERFLRLRPESLDKEALHEIISVSIPKALESMAKTAKTWIFILLVSYTGSVAGTCAYSIIQTVSYTTGIFAASAAGAAGILAGICCGEKNGEELEGVAVLSLWCCLINSVFLIAVLLILNRPLSFALTETEETAAMLMFAIFCTALSLPFSILVRIRISWLQAAGKTDDAKWAGVLSELILPVISAGTLSVFSGVYGVFVSIPVSYFLTLAIIYIFHSVRAGSILPGTKSFLEVGEEYFCGPGDVISYPLESLEDCALASEQVMLFCKGHHLDERKGYMAGLCAEELSIHAAAGMSGKEIRQNPFDLRVVIDGTEVIVRLRDGAEPFNLKELADSLDKKREHPDDLSLRMLLGTAQNVSYYRCYGMNTTIIRV